MRKIKPGYYIDWAGDLLIVYPDLSFEYWVEDYHYSKDIELLKCYLSVGYHKFLNDL